MRGMDIKRAVADFTGRLQALVEEISVARARQAVMHALGEKRGRVPKGLSAVLGRKPRRKGPPQLCPVPGCRNAAAPVFGMVCAEHKDVSKRKIKQYREERRAAKLGAKGEVRPAAKRRAKPVRLRAARPTKSGNAKAKATKKAARQDTAAKAARSGAPAGSSKPAKVEPSPPTARPSVAASSESTSAAS